MPRRDFLSVDTESDTEPETRVTSTRALCINFTLPMIAAQANFFCLYISITYETLQRWHALRSNGSHATSALTKQAAEETLYVNINLDIEAFDKFWTLINDKLDGWLETAIQHIPNMIVAIMVVCAFAIIAKIATALLRRAFRRSMESQQIADLIVAMLRVFIMAIGAFVALELIGLKGTVTSLLAGAGIIGLAIGFAFQDMTENLIAGIAMGVRKPFKLGDIISSDGVFGTVKAINLRNTLIETFGGQMEVVPNKVLFRNVLTNYSRYQKRKVEIPVGISYADDPSKARDVIVESINQCDFVIDPDSTAVYAEGFGDSSVNLQVWFWIDYPGDTGYMEARHQGVVRIKQALEEHDILIPFPIRTLEFDAKGGTTLDEIVDTGISNMADFRSRQSSKGNDEPGEGKKSARQ